jgi:hypothetical protein
MQFPLDVCLGLPQFPKSTELCAIDLGRRFGFIFIKKRTLLLPGPHGGR